MKKSVVLSLLLFCFGSVLMAQSGSILSLEVQAGIGSYTTFSDYQQIVFTIEGQGYNNSSGNVAESDLVPYVAVGLNYQLSERWQINPFIHYLSGKGTHYENDFVQFRVSDINPAEQIFSAPADNEIKALTAGANLRYRLMNLLGNHIYLGSGIAFTTRSHFYRNEMDVDFGADRIAQRIDERFTTEKKSAVFIPLSVGLERAVSDRLTLILNAQTFTGVGLDDVAWSAGIGLRYNL